MQSQNRYFHLYSDVIFPSKRQDKGVPTVYEQAEALGGKFTRIVKGLPRNNVANFSPSIVSRLGKTYIAWRSQPEAFGSRYANKYFSNPKKLFSQPKVVVCWINDHFEAVSAAIPPIGKNHVVGAPEKNWAFFAANDELNCLYSTRPLVVERETGPSIELDTKVLDKATRGAPTFNSTAPVDLGYCYLVFYHWKHMTCTEEGKPYLIYHVGAYLVDKKFKEITYLTEEPLFTGSLNDRVIEWTDVMGNVVSNQPAVILPFGALLEGDELVMSLGVNDAFMGIFRTKLENIMRRMKKAD